MIIYTIFGFVFRWVERKCHFRLTGFPNFPSVSLTPCILKQVRFVLLAALRRRLSPQLHKERKTHKNAVFSCIQLFCFVFFFLLAVIRLLWLCDHFFSLSLESSFVTALLLCCYVHFCFHQKWKQKHRWQNQSQYQKKQAKSLFIRIRRCVSVWLRMCLAVSRLRIY